MIKSNTTNERKSEQAFIPHAPTLFDSVAQNLWQCHAFWIGQSVEKNHYQISAILEDIQTVNDCHMCTI